MKVKLDKVANLRGQKAEFGIVEKKDYGLVIPTVGEKFYLVEEYRYPVDARSWAFPQGHFEEDESLEGNAARELGEETGLVAAKLQYLGQLYLAPGFCTQKFSVYVAKNCRQSKSKRDATESDMVVGAFSFDELRSMIKRGEIKDSPTVAAFGLYLLEYKTNAGAT